jgi:hypothetical protein
MLLRRLFRRPRDLSPERIFEEQLGIPRLPDGPTHPVYDAEARQRLAQTIAPSLNERCDASRAAGAWSAEMDDLWNRLAEPGAEHDPEIDRTYYELVRLLSASGF